MGQRSRRSAGRGAGAAPAASGPSWGFAPAHTSRTPFGCTSLCRLPPHPLPAGSAPGPHGARAPRPHHQTSSVKATREWEGGETSGQDKRLDERAQFLCAEAAGRSGGLRPARSPTPCALPDAGPEGTRAPGEFLRRCHRHRTPERSHRSGSSRNPRRLRCTQAAQHLNQSCAGTATSGVTVPKTRTQILRC